MQDNVKYQLERAEDALRTALNLGSAKEDPYLLRNIAETLSSINGWKRSFSSNSPRYNTTAVPYMTLTGNNTPVKTTPDSTPCYYPTMASSSSTDFISFNLPNIPTRF